MIPFPILDEGLFNEMLNIGFINEIYEDEEREIEELDFEE